MGGFMVTEGKKKQIKDKYGADDGSSILNASFTETGNVFRGFGDARLDSIDKAMDTQEEGWAKKLRADKYAVGKKTLLSGSEMGLEDQKKKKTLLG